jgi:deoxyribodipyrimidine photo-lyase
MVDQRLIYHYNSIPVSKGPVIYWMSRDQRIDDNRALSFALQTAREINQPVFIVFTLVTDFLGAPWRHYHFMLEGLKEVETRARELGLAFILLEGDPAESVTRLVKEKKAGLLVTDFSPLKPHLEWRQQAASSVECSMMEVDTHNVLPVRWISQKQEYSAYTLRLKINRVLEQFIVPFTEINMMGIPSTVAADPVDWDDLYKRLNVDRKVEPVTGFTPGYRAGMRALQSFLNERLDRYDSERNDANAEMTSRLSPWFHFGHIAPGRAAYEVDSGRIYDDNSASFLEELIVRREVAENFCLNNSGYDSLTGAPAWALKTLAEHADDPREYTYSREQWDRAETHDPLWNAAQNQVKRTGHMHGYMRMYWAKKILEWSPSASEAVQNAIFLNDRYSLDGREPSGYAGILWSIAGLHDRAWGERGVFGKVRYMSYNGIKKKFDISKYIAAWSGDTGETRD